MLTIKEGLLNGNSSYFYLYKKVFNMAINIGNIEVAKFYLCTEDDIKIYLEETLLYPQLPSFKFKAEYSGGVSYSAECDSSTTLATGDTKPSGYQYTAMTSSEVGQCITNIDVEVFRYCTSLSSVTLSDSVTTIGNSAFRGCSSLTSINIPSSVTRIETEAFNPCTGLTNVNIGTGITYIGNWAFNGCSSLTSLTVNATTPPSLDNYGISLASTVVIYVPAASVSAYQTDWSRYASQIQAIP